MTNTPFHRGELTVQERTGETAIARRNGSAAVGSVCRSTPIYTAAAHDRSLQFGRGIGHVGVEELKVAFASGDGASLDIDLNRALVDPRDPVWANVRRQKRLGSLVIEFASHRRIRVNGAARLMGTSASGLTSKKVSRLAQSTLHADMFESRL